MQSGHGEQHQPEKGPAGESSHFRGAGGRYNRVARLVDCSFFEIEFTFTITFGQLKCAQRWAQTKCELYTLYDLFTPEMYGKLVCIPFRNGVFTCWCTTHNM